MANFIKIFFMALESYHLKMEIFTRETFNKEILAAQENLFMQMEILIKAN